MSTNKHRDKAELDLLRSIIESVRERCQESTNDRDDESPAHFLADDILDILAEYES